MAASQRKPQALEALRRKKAEEQDQLLLHKAQAMLEKDQYNFERDAQDEVLDTCLEAMHWAGMFLRQRSQQALARVNYRINTKLAALDGRDVRDGVESAKKLLLDAMRDEEMAVDNLRLLLPQCDRTLVMRMPELRDITLLPWELRDMVGNRIQPPEVQEPAQD